MPTRAIRAAKFADIVRLRELFAEMQAASRYAGFVDLNPTKLQKVLLALIHKHGNPHDGGTLVNVVERDGTVAGFMVGVLDAIYHVGDRLAAKDVFLHVQPGAKGIAEASQLIDRYIAWAEANPSVVEINLSWTDTIPGAERIDGLYRRKGFRQCGAIYERTVERSIKSA